MAGKVRATVAVVTRTKDRAVLLERAIQSIHNQTFKDYVHVIINDAGDPAPVDALVSKYKKLIDGRVSVIHNVTSKGMEAASNKAINSVNSDYIAIHDDDDSWDPQFLELTVKYLSENDAKGVVVVTDKIDEEIVGDTVKKLSQSRWQPHIRSIRLYEQCLDNFATPISFIYRRDTYNTIGAYNEELPVAGDWDFALRFLLAYDIHFLVTDKPLAFYHHRPTSTGINQNSVFKDKGLLHEQKLTMLANRHLRAELQAGKLGVGYLISSQLADAHHRRTQDERLKRLENEMTERLEGHINLKVSEVQNAIEQTPSRKIYKTLKNIVR